MRKEYCRLLRPSHRKSCWEILAAHSPPGQYFYNSVSTVVTVGLQEKYYAQYFPTYPRLRLNTHEGFHGTCYRSVMSYTVGAPARAALINSLIDFWGHSEVVPRLQLSLARHRLYTSARCARQHLPLPPSVESSATHGTDLCSHVLLAIHVISRYVYPRSCINT